MITHALVPRGDGLVSAAADGRGRAFDGELGHGVILGPALDAALGLMGDGAHGIFGQGAALHMVVRDSLGLGGLRVRGAWFLEGLVPSLDVGAWRAHARHPAPAGSGLAVSQGPGARRLQG